MFFPAAKIILRHPSDRTKILLIKRTIHGIVYFEPAGGRVEVNFERKIAETLEECAIREAKEELGLTVTVDRYIGSYYFFWTIDPNKCSSCAVFIGTVIDPNIDNLDVYIDQIKTEGFITNTDTNELHFEPIWITLDDVLSQKVRINDTHVGLKEIILNCFNNPL